MSPGPSPLRSAVWGPAEFRTRRAKRHFGPVRQPLERGRRDFAVRFQRPFPRAAHRRSLEPTLVDRGQPAIWLGTSRLRERCARCRRSSALAAYSDSGDPQLRAPDGHRGCCLVGLAATDVPGQQRAVPIVRAALGPLRRTIDGARSTGARCGDRRAGGRLRHQYLECAGRRSCGEAGIAAHARHTDPRVRHPDRRGAYRF